MNIIKDNLKVIIGALIALIFIIAGAIWLSVTFGGQAYRNITVSDINGSVTIIRDTRQFFASKSTVLRSGDIINTNETSRLRIRMDFDKYIVIEPNSSVYIYHTGITDSGEISVNIACGAVICQLNKALNPGENFVVKTPNTAVHVRGTVFRTEFELKPEYNGFENVMITHVQNFEGSVKLQLYNHNSEKVDEPMLLTERTSAELVSCDKFAQYGYLNYDTDMYALDELTVMELIRISGERQIAYTLDELNIALKAVRRRAADESIAAATTTLPAETETTETQAATTAPPVTEPPVSETVTAVPTTPATEEAPSETTTNTLATTRATQIYTTYTGPKWWEMPNEDPDMNDDNFDDGGVFNFGD
ncbi:MAG: FecR domain-containing protein [Oscillospiraceae bacterium]|nr:FecR domain-containing protein [Oscillospiraceae bacterium]